MRRAKRILLIASMLLLTAGATSASLWRHKGDQKPAEAAAPAAMSLTAIEIDSTNPTPRLLLRTTGTPAYTSYSPTPDSFVIDLSGASKAATLTIPAALPPGIAAINTEEVTEMGTRVTRVTLRLSQAATLEAAADDRAVAIPLPMAAVPAATVAAAQPAAQPEVKSETRKEEPLPAVTPLPLPPTPLASSSTPSTASSTVAESAPPAVETVAAQAEPSKPLVEEPVVKAEAIPLAKAKTLKSVTTSGSGEAFSVQLGADGEVAYNAFNLEKPSRIVLDLNGVKDAVAKSVMTVAGGPVKKIRIAQFKSAPEPVTRVVLDLDARSEYKVTKDGDRLVVSFGGAPAPMAVAAAEAPHPSPLPAKRGEGAMSASPSPRESGERVAEGRVRGETKPVETKKPEPAKSTIDVPAQVPVIAENVPEWKMPEKRATGVIRAGQQPATPTRRSTRTTATPQPAAAAGEDVFSESPQALPTLGNTAAPTGTQPTIGGGAVTAAGGGRTLNSSERVYTGEPISLNLKDADIKDVIRTFSQLTGLNIAVDPGVGGSVTVDFTDVPWDQALDIILRQNNLGYIIEGNVMRVATLGRLAEEAAATRKLQEEQRLNVPTRTVSYKLSYARAQEVAGLLREIASSRARIIVDNRTNQLIISEIPAYLDTLRALIDAVDVPTRQVVIEARIVETSKTFLQQYGVEWGFRGTMDPALGTGTGLVFPNRVDFVGGPFDFGAGNPVLTFSLGNVLGTFTLDMALLATESEGLTRIVSAPRVQTQDNIAAEIQSGFQIPYQTRVNFTTTVAYVDATLRLSVTPQITESGTVIMDIAVQKNEPATGLAVEGGAGTPLSTRSARTRLMVRDGGTAVIAGIYQTKFNNSQTRMPFLHQIPVLGNLFKTHNISSTHDELLIFITPRIVRAS